MELTRDVNNQIRKSNRRKKNQQQEEIIENVIEAKNVKGTEKIQILYTIVKREGKILD